VVGLTRLVQASHDGLEDCDAITVVRQGARQRRRHDCLADLRAGAGDEEALGGGHQAAS
jgi:hypothetical protein